MNLAKKLGIGLLLLTLAGCYDNTHPGYRAAKDGIYYKRITLGDETRKPNQGDVVWVNLQVRTLTDSLLLQRSFSGQLGTSELGNDLLNSTGIQQALALMVEGDSASFILPASRFNIDLTTESDQKVVLNMHLKQIQTLEAIRAAWAAAMEERELDEQRLLNVYLDSLGLEREKHIGGIYYQELRSGRGRNAAKGDRVRVHYRAYFLDGTEFDATYAMPEPFEFRLGDPEQVLPGFETGIRLMRKGGKSRLIIPSLAAFGEEGSSTGIVPPYTTLIYEVELLGL